MRHTLGTLAVLMVAFAAYASASASASASAVNVAPCNSWVKNPAKGIVSPASAICIQQLDLWWLTCLNAAYDRGAAINSMTCFKLRWGYENALIYSKLPRIKKRNALIDLEDGLDRLCNPDDPAICSELANVERAIRKLAA